TTTTTVSALRTAVMVAQALTNQKLVLDQISVLNKTTGDMIAGTARMLKQQAGQIQQNASSSTIELNKLKSAFADIYETMDLMADYKVKALQNMQATVDALGGEVEKSKTYLDRVRREHAATEAGRSVLDLGQSAEVDI
ncbi:MAG: toxic anion resistance protein, partial [Gammaproteobacteria bacterium]